MLMIKCLVQPKILSKIQADNFPDKKIIFDLENVRQPALVDVT